ncbi:MAG: hypothetical protein LC687_05510 [Actinobacteria bacterium]|nr:hypothetical protein [Actinomycetota bacterium]MCA1807288.1 hypothetical protein [Actinomycetota bacterium]
MAKTIGAAGYIGIAVETTSGTYEAPTKFFPIMSESLSWTQNTNWRRVIRGTTDVIGAVAGNGNVEGDIEAELLTDVLPYMLLAARGTLTKGGTAPSFTYSFVPGHGALAPNTLSITIVRGDEAFGYTGCVVSSMNFGVDNDMATVTYSVLGIAEESVSVPATPTYTDDVPFGAGNWNIQIPTSTQIFDADNFSLEINDNGEVQYRLKDSLGAQFIKFGERDVQLTLDRDFEDRGEYDNFKALTEQSVTVGLNESVSNQVEFSVVAAIIDAYAVNLSSVGDLVRSSTTYVGTHGSGDGAYAIEITTEEDVTIPV